MALRALWLWIRHGERGQHSFASFPLVPTWPDSIYWCGINCYVTFFQNINVALMLCCRLEWTSAKHLPLSASWGEQWTWPQSAPGLDLCECCPLSRSTTVPNSLWRVGCTKTSIGGCLMSCQCFPFVQTPGHHFCLQGYPCQHHPTCLLRIPLWREEEIQPPGPGFQCVPDTIQMQRGWVVSPRQSTHNSWARAGCDILNLPTTGVPLRGSNVSRTH